MLGQQPIVPMHASMRVLRVICMLNSLITGRLCSSLNNDAELLHPPGCAPQVRTAKKAELQAQRRSEKAAREAAQKDKEQRSYSHLMQARPVAPLRMMLIIIRSHVKVAKARRAKRAEQPSLCDVLLFRGQS